MRILFANDGIGDAGGVQNYLGAVMPALAARGHVVALLHLDRLRPGEPSPAPAGTPHFCIDELGTDAALAAALAWKPSLAFIHNMRPLEVDARLSESVPVVKMMHGYFGTCVSGQKAHLWPRPVPCSRPLGVGCLAHYGPRRCGQLRPGYVAKQWGWAHEQNDLFARYTAMVTPSRALREEYVRNGARPDRVHAIPLFPTLSGEPVDAPDGFRLLFLGRMTAIKGGDVLIRAVADAGFRAGIRIPLTMAGDGPQRAAWERLATARDVDATFTGWVADDARSELFRRASLVAVPSVWPEPFGLVGLEAGVFGVPSLAFDVGGVSDWLADGGNGFLVDGDPPTAEKLADALVHAVQHPDELRRLRAGARAVALRMSLDRHVSVLEGVLSRAAEAPA
ncbi:MAG TPA: glycosyltransferase family 4 protein [Longimicrobium sp.]|jgi:glycosyltransferase involved in cell wall biosynthesis|uniref:glycosyltransferase family 4 protein n=1 Tax=Longimicrobium sp. TaxID=2029185 RepID=UPI002ED88041